MSETLILILGIILFLIGFIFVAFIYFLPVYIASKKDHPNFGVILLITVLFGWTLLGWLVCMIWACIDTNNNETNNMNGSNKYEDLEKLQKLKENGVISENEFESEKLKLLQ